MILDEDTVLIGNRGDFIEILLTSMPIRAAKIINLNMGHPNYRAHMGHCEPKKGQWKEFQYTFEESYVGQHTSIYRFADDIQIKKPIVL